jgi:dTDP-4-amino-4,6-dideoxygalactose transaminase
MSCFDFHPHGIYGNQFCYLKAQYEALLTHLRDHGVRAGLHYPIPVHLQPCHEGFPFLPDSLPVTESVASRGISLPMYPEITRAQIEVVCDRVRQFHAS